MDQLVYPRERTLGTITLVLGLLVWLGLIVGTFGGAFIALAIGFVLYLFAQSALIAHIKGNGVELSNTQFPDLYAQFNECCDRLEITVRPQAYILNGNGGLNAFATKFLGTEYVVLLSDVVDAMDKHADGVRFYIGHELGHLRMKHLSGHLLRWPVLWLPLLGAAYSRARESTCDRHGLACSGSPEGAARALAALSAGSERWEQLDIGAYQAQSDRSTGFWMSFHELIAGYPWLTKRAARVMNTGRPMPRRNGLAYVLAVFIPYAGRLGAGFGLLILVYIVGGLAAIAIPAYQDYTIRAQVSEGLNLSGGAKAAVTEFVQERREWPSDNDSAGLVPPEQISGLYVSGVLIEDGLVIITYGNNAHVSIQGRSLVLVPDAESLPNVTWECSTSDIENKWLPAACRSN